MCKPGLVHSCFCDDIDNVEEEDIDGKIIMMMMVVECDDNCFICCFISIRGYFITGNHSFTDDSVDQKLKWFIKN